MALLNFFPELGVYAVLVLAILAFIAGLIDAVVGGGGLITLPSLLVALPQTNVVTIFGTNKLAAFAGTSVAAIKYSKRINYNFKLLLSIAFCAALASFLGARVVSFINVKTLKPIIFVILVLIAIYTFLKKDLGKTTTKQLSFTKQLIFGCLIALFIGFYDGFFGPGTGSFLVLGFVTILGFNFLQASAYAKVVNCLTNLGALIVFVKQGNFMLPLAIVMAICNMAGNWVGAHLALKKGNEFIRIIFLIIVVIMIIRYGYEIWF